MPIEQEDGVVTVAAPLHPERSDAILAWVGEAFPGKFVTQVIATHHHDDHSAGLRLFVAAGVTVIGHFDAEPYIRQNAAARAQLRLRKRPLQPGNGGCRDRATRVSSVHNGQNTGLCGADESTGNTGNVMLWRFYGMIEQIMLFGPYWLLRRIGLGDLAEVFVATRSRAGEDTPGPMSLLAVKRISREMSRYSEVFELFAREGELSAKFDHPKVIKVFDTGEVGDCPYIAMEYVPGADLAHLVDRVSPGKLPPGLAVRLVLDVCEALAYVHDAVDDAGRALDVVHGDVTPTNILVSTSGLAKLIDFSVASSGLRDGEDKTVRGTYAYMSPEQARGAAIDRRTDIFALSVLLWELLSGRRLFRRAANYLTLTAVVEDAVPRLADLDIDIGGDAAAIDEILARALAKDRDKRYADIDTLSRELRGVATQLGWDLRPWTLQSTVRQLLSEPATRRGRSDIRTPRRAATDRGEKPLGS